jgi:primosomal replication protein N
MWNISSPWLSRLVTCCVLPMLLFSSVSAALAQSGGAPGGMESSTSDTSRTPFRIKLKGFLNTQPEEGSKVLKLGIHDFQETYQFELIQAESVDDKQVGEMAILQQVGKYDVDFDLIGPRNLLSKVGQAEPGTPLTIVGFFTQRNRKLQLESVEVVGLTEQPAPIE